MIKILEEYSSHQNTNLALDASICIGKLGIRDSQKAINKLVDIVRNEKDWHKKALSLEALVRLFDVKDSKILNSVMIQIDKAPHWTSRASAIKLLSFIGISEFLNLIMLSQLKLFKYFRPVYCM